MALVLWAEAKLYSWVYIVEGLNRKGGCYEGGMPKVQSLRTYMHALQLSIKAHRGTTALIARQVV